ncbi:hypothetical protein ACIRU8_27200 [Streptomyces sp. NPDC101175]|uniref:hypothetical protein n=1 Tax=Streptomyces sp. NPDC101175 TaxID=3366123 RepID=UPI003837A25F
MTAPAWWARRVDTTGRPGGEILIGVVDGRHDSDDPTFVVAQGFLAFVEPFEMQRFQMIAAMLRARLVVVETPGAGFAASRLQPEERRALLRGDFRVPARRMLRAATEVIGSAGPDGATGVLGYSLGASFAAAMAAVSGNAETGPPLETVVLVEPVAVQRWGATALLSAVRRENRLVGAYLEETATVAGAVPPLEARPGEAPNTRRRVDLLLLANALRAGCLSDDLRAALRRPARRTRRLVVVRGEESSLSPRQAVRDLVTSAKGQGIEACLVHVPGPHGFWQSLPAVGSTMTTLAHTLGALPS